MQHEKTRDNEKMGRKAGLAAFVGTTVEWYDFYIYGTASALVFGPLFFPDASPAIGVLLSFATFWVGFLARPLGGIIFGHLGDRVGRKKALVITMMLMGGSTLAIGVMPTYDTIGFLAPILLVLCRLIQGVAVGGEWGGAVLIATEHVERRRGYLFGAYAQQGSPAGQLLASLAFLIISQLPDDAFMSWGWRIPFLASVVLIGVGMFMRLRLSETPAMQKLREDDRTVRFPLVELVRKHTWMLVLGIFACAIAFTAGYIKNTFALSWAVNDVGFTRDTFLSVVLVSSIAQFLVQPFGALLAGRFDVRRLVTVLLILELPALPIMFALVAKGEFLWAAVGMVIATIPHVMYYSILAGLLAESFPAAIRYTGISLAYGLTGTLLGGTTPMIGQSLFAAFDSIVPVILFAMVPVLMSLFGANALLRRAAAAEKPSADGGTIPGDAGNISGTALLERRESELS
ncbi:MFS transporter [Nocardia carnea]|uniref:MFS transporter n=1 Tax=Nocardia carnea TaxID=37328 RepID=UPI0024589056|nr:MFS transporter [Nocardia carnea]